MKLNGNEQAVLKVYRAEAANTGRRKGICLDKHELAARTGIPASQCCNARASLIAKRVIRKMGWTVPMKVELL